MKKIFIFSLVALSTLTVNAQRRKTRAATTQGNWAVRLGLGYDATKGELPASVTDTKTNFSIAPALGYFVADNLEIGVEANITNSTEKISSSLSVQKTTIPKTGFNIYGQKYFPVNNWFSFTGKAYVGLNFGNFTDNTTVGGVTTSPTASNGTINGFGGGLAAGFAFTPINNFAITATLANLSVNSWTKDPKGADDVENYTEINLATIAQSANIGFTWFFGRKLQD